MTSAQETRAITKDASFDQSWKREDIVEVR
jgi:hypothetical protein